MKLDKFDHKILGLIQENNRTSQRELSDRVHLSPSAVNRRIAAMEEAGIIRANVALVDPAKAGRPITIIVEVALESEKLEHFDAVKTRFLACPEIQQIYYVTGEMDFVLILTVADMAEYERLTRELFFAEGNVRRFRTLVVMDRAKVTLQVPIS